jgi:hypothetical protein
LLLFHFSRTRERGEGRPEGGGGSGKGGFSIPNLNLFSSRKLIKEMSSQEILCEVDKKMPLTPVSRANIPQVPVGVLLRCDANELKGYKVHQRGVAIAIRELLDGNLFRLKKENGEGLLSCSSDDAIFQNAVLKTKTKIIF